MQIGIGIELGVIIKSPAASIVYTIQDSFTATNGVLATAHTPDIGTGPWTTVNSDQVWDINANKLGISSSVGGNFGTLNINSGKSDCTIEADITWATGNAVGLGFRSDGTLNNRWAFVFMETGTDTKLDYLIGGAFTQVELKPFTPVNGQTYHFKVVLSGSSIKCYIDGVLMHDVVNVDNQALTRHGFAAYTPFAVPTVKFDNFTVR